MSETFSRYIDELIEDPVFRKRHPHFHVRLFPIADLDFVYVHSLEGSALRLYNKTYEQLLSGALPKQLTIELSDESATPTLAAGDPILQAARDAGFTEMMARVRYVSREIEPVWWRESNAPTLDAITTEDDVAITTDDDIELME